MFGISTHCLHHQPLGEALECLAPLTDTVEILDDGYHYLESAEILLNYDFRYFLHAPARSVNIASQLEPIRRASVEVIGQCFAIAGEVDADVVIHPGYCAWQEERERGIASMKKSLEELQDLARDLSITFFVENMPNWEHFLLRFPDELDIIGEIGLALDVGHAHLNGCLAEFLECPVAHFHLHDNNGKEDTHEAIGDGEIDFKPVVKALSKNDAAAIIEVSTFRGVQKSIEVLNDLRKQ